MRPVRRLTVRRDALSELAPDDLRAVAGAEITRPNCRPIWSLYDSCLCPTYVPPPTGMC